MSRLDVTEKIIATKVAKGLKWSDVAAKVGLSKEWVTAACLGQMTLTAEQAGVVAELLAEVRDIRRVGSCALDLCMVAAGQLDAYFESGVHVWDWAAAALIAQEAGALVRLPVPGDDADDLVIAAAPGVFVALTGQLERVGYR